MDWLKHWKAIAATQSENVEHFALAAYEGDALAESIRFFPKLLTKPRFGAWRDDQHPQKWSNDSLDVTLINKVIDVSRGPHRSIQALAWSNIRDTRRGVRPSRSRPIFPRGLRWKWESKRISGRGRTCVRAVTARTFDG